jgi:hypothetical protein
MHGMMADEEAGGESVTLYDLFRGSPVKDQDGKRQKEHTRTQPVLIANLPSMKYLFDFSSPPPHLCVCRKENRKTFSNIHEQQQAFAPFCISVIPVAACSRLMSNSFRFPDSEREKGR